MEAEEDGEEEVEAEGQEVGEMASQLRSLRMKT